VNIFVFLLAQWIIPMSRSKSIPLQTHILILMTFIWSDMGIGIPYKVYLGSTITGYYFIKK